MDNETDSIHEIMQGQSRLLITVAGQVAEAMARAREKRLRDLEATDTRAAEELRRRLDAERAAASAAVKPAASPGWADTASAEQITEAWGTAKEWSKEDSTAEAARRELWDWSKERGVDFEQMQIDVDNLRESVLRRSAEMRAQAGGDRDESGELRKLAAEDLEEAWTARDMDDHVAAALAERDAANALAESDQVYDSAARREELAADLTKKGVDPEGVSAAVLADVGSAVPITESVAAGAQGKTPAKVAKAKPAKRRGRGQGPERARGR